MADKRIDKATGTETVGHEWDGIEELNTPLPRWWLWTFYLTIIFAIVYVILYPAWPMIDRATTGTLGWSSRSDLAEEMHVADQAQVASATNWPVFRSNAFPMTARLWRRRSRAPSWHHAGRSGSRHCPRTR